ncbi:hypothetical protein H5410_047158 [Solanum commersonii]|uniref:Uncharacterized protein n=1 Tax=Solanum commersonii TaxID=4109 RepID=A0A9J5XHH6_SOLCO|nr:hypothetical protein H5410_047158 [Solanum commersonii]
MSVSPKTALELVVLALYLMSLNRGKRPGLFAGKFHVVFQLKGHKTFLWNSSIRKYKKLSYPKTTLGYCLGRIYGFGYDAYKVESDSRRTVDNCGGLVLQQQSSKFVNRKLHWTTSRFNFDNTHSSISEIPLAIQCTHCSLLIKLDWPILDNNLKDSSFIGGFGVSFRIVGSVNGLI